MRFIPLIAALATCSTLATSSFDAMLFDAGGTVDFTITSDSAFKIVVDRIDNPFGEPEDAIRNVVRCGGNCGTGTILNPMGQDGSACDLEFPSTSLTREIRSIRTRIKRDVTTVLYGCQEQRRLL